jgi:hypothetical protein
VLLIIAEILIFIGCNAPNAGNSTMKLRMDKTLRFWVEVEGKIAWKASPRFLTKLADAERDAQDELEEFP